MLEVSQLVTLIDENLIYNQCRVFLGTDDLEEYFTKNPIEFEDLRKLSNGLVTRYLTTEASERALYGDTTHGFAKGSDWDYPSNKQHPPSPDAMDVDCSDEELEPFVGDQVLANTILRMRDSMLHYEFQFAVADGDIGRAMNIMAVGSILLNTMLCVLNQV